MNPVPSWTQRDLMLAAILTIIALVLRIIGLNEGLWFDEIETMVRYAHLPAREIIEGYGNWNNHILYSLLAHYSIGWFGESAWSIRLPAVVFGVATIPATYYLGRQLASRDEAFLASAFLALNYHHVWFSQNARGYTGQLLGTVLLSIFFVRLLIVEKPKFRLVLAYAIVAALATWIHLTVALVVIAHGIIWLVMVSGQAGKAKTDFKPAAAQSLLLAGLFSLALYAPVWFQLWDEFDHANVTRVASGQKHIWRTVGWVLAELVHAMNKAIPGGWPVISLGILAVATGTWAYLRRGVVVAGILILPLLVTMVFVAWFSNALFPRFVFGSMVFFLLIAIRGGFVLSRVVLPFVSKRLVAVIGLIFALATATMVPGAWKPKQDYFAAMTFVNDHRVPGDGVACTGLAYYAISYYLRMDCMQVRSATELNDFEQAHSRTWLMYTFPVSIRGFTLDEWSKIQKDYLVVTRISGTVNDGDIVIMLNSPETSKDLKTHQ